MSFLARLLGPNRPAASAPPERRERQPQAEAEPADALDDALHGRGRPPQSARARAARKRIMAAFDDGENQRKLVEALRRMLHDGREPGGFGDGRGGR